MPRAALGVYSILLAYFAEGLFITFELFAIMWHNNHKLLLQFRLLIETLQQIRTEHKRFVSLLGNIVQVTSNIQIYKN